MGELHALRISEMTKGLREKKFSAAEVVEAHFARIHALQPKLNAFLHVDHENAMRRAREIDAAMLRNAGAILIGNTNTPEFLMAYETDNRIAGKTSNPWSLDHSAGGSSGGEAAAIASGCSSGGVGSDGGGSIRVPAHFCGICGLKPTPGRIPITGHFPEGGG